MGFTLDTSVPALAVFLQGIFSFFSPCIFPLVPLYISYLAGGAKTVAPDGSIHYPRKQVLVNTIFFVLGISFVFFLLGFGFTAFGRFFSTNRVLFARISGIVMVLFGLYQVGFFGRSAMLETEHRLPFRLNKLTMGPLAAFLLGFTFSFAWTPCVGPILGSVLLMASTTQTAFAGLLLIGVFTAGFILPFLAVGLFTGKVLDFFKSHGNIVRYTVKAGAILLILMGLMTFTGFMNGFSSYLSGFGDNSGLKQEETAKQEDPIPDESPQNTTVFPTVSQGFDFTLVDQNGETHTLSDYKGKTIFLNFWATWCPPCQKEMPYIQELYEEYGNNQEDVVILGVAAPNWDREKDADYVVDYLENKGYTFPTVLDEGGNAFIQYGIYSYPTTYMINEKGEIYGVVNSALTKEMMQSIIQQTQDAVTE